VTGPVAPVPPAGHGPGPTVPGRFLAACAAYPGRVAVTGDGEALTYRELGARVAALAGGLAERGAGRGDLVALGASRSADYVTAVLAIMTAGAAVVPVDLRQAPERGRRLLAGLAPALVLGEVQDAAAWPGAVTVADLAAGLAADQGDSGPRGGGPGAGDLAYVEHTSGSTGVPKAVAVPHGALDHRIGWAQELYPLRPGDTVLHAGSLLFDFSFWEILAPLCAGATVAVAPPGLEAEPAALAEFMVAHWVTVAHFVPSLLTEFLAVTLSDGASPAALAGLRCVLAGGERLPAALARRLLDATPAALFNQYGPTEACIDVLAGQVRAGDLAGGTVSLGRPVPGVIARVLDDAGQPVPDGEPGGLYVGGPCLAWGYRGQAGRTAAQFVPDPWSREPGARLYRTGDLVRRDPGGGLEFLGRADDQVKIRGVRIELGEVEDALRGHPTVTAAYVTLADGALVAHVAPDQAGTDQASTDRASTDQASTGQAGDDDLRAFLAARLPAAAIPAAFARYPALPRLPSGKVDRSALAAARGPAAASAPAADPPATATEQAVAQIWADVLGVPAVGRSADFFALGGQSLLAMRMIARVRRQFGVRVPARVIFDAATVERFAAFLDAA
jgi:amino acid adenylation domain-containing protein